MARMCVLLGVGAAAAGVVGLAGSVNAWPGVGARVQAAWTGVEQRAETARATDGILKNPGSFIVVHRTLVEEPVAGGAGEQTGGLIAVPLNARAGDPAFAEIEPEKEEVWIADDWPTAYGPYGTVFADGVRLGYSTLRRNGLHRSPRVDRDLHRRDGEEAPEFGSSDLHRSAQLRFGEAAQPRLAEQEEGFRRAQLRFHESTVTPGVSRGSDGLRHERTGPSERRGGRRSRD